MDDLPAVFDLTVGSPGASGWSAADYARACGGDLDGWVAAVGLDAASGERERVIGFVIARRMADELEVLNLAVEATFRRRGVAGRLLETALQQGRASGGKRAFLEVRASNAAAIAFYEHHGFARTGRRTGYYANPPEDALVLCRPLV